MLETAVFLHVHRGLPVHRFSMQLLGKKFLKLSPLRQLFVVRIFINVRLGRDKCTRETEFVRILNIDNASLLFEHVFLGHIARIVLFSFTPTSALTVLKVARYSFSGSIPPKFEHKLRCQKQSFGKIATTVVLDKDENLS